MSAIVNGVVRDLGKPYADGTLRLEIHVPMGRSDGLQLRTGERVAVRLRVAGSDYQAGLRATPNNKYAWVCPDVRGAGGADMTLGRVLTDAGFVPNEPVRLIADGSSLTVQQIGMPEETSHSPLQSPVVGDSETLDAAARLDELKSLTNGWLDGVGLAPSRDGLDWLSGAFDRYFADDLPPPYLYATPEGGVRAEWPIKPLEVSLDIDLTTRVGDWHSLNLDDDTERTKTLNLDDADAWAWLAGELRHLAGVTA